jgi:hypothetical protein
MLVRSGARAPDRTSDLTSMAADHAAATDYGPDDGQACVTRSQIRSITTFATTSAESAVLLTMVPRARNYLENRPGGGWIPEAKPRHPARTPARRAWAGPASPGVRYRGTNGPISGRSA